MGDEDCGTSRSVHCCCLICPVLHSSSASLLRQSADPDEENRPLTDEELREELLRRERVMQQGGVPEGAATDQWRVCSEATALLSSYAKDPCVPRNN